MNTAFGNTDLTSRDLARKTDRMLQIYLEGFKIPVVHANKVHFVAKMYQFLLVVDFQQNFKSCRLRIPCQFPNPLRGETGCNQKNKVGTSDLCFCNLVFV